MRPLIVLTGRRRQAPAATWAAPARPPGTPRQSLGVLPLLGADLRVGLPEPIVGLLGVAGLLRAVAGTVGLLVGDPLVDLREGDVLTLPGMPATCERCWAEPAVAFVWWLAGFVGERCRAADAVRSQPIVISRPG